MRFYMCIFNGLVAYLVLQSVLLISFNIVHSTCTYAMHGLVSHL